MAEENGGLNIKSLIIIVILIVIIAAGTSYGVMYYLTNIRNNEEEKEVEKMGPTYNLGEFVVNLSGMGNYQVVSASIVVEVDNEEVINQLEERSPQIRDTIISILRGQSIEDIEEPGATKIKGQIKTEVNEFLSKGSIKSVWFTQLVLQ